MLFAVYFSNNKRFYTTNSHRTELAELKLEPVSNLEKVVQRLFLK
jgi:hypothetical protein